MFADPPQTGAELLSLTAPGVAHSLLEFLTEGAGEPKESHQYNQTFPLRSELQIETNNLHSLKPERRDEGMYTVMTTQLQPPNETINVKPSALPLMAIKAFDNTQTKLLLTTLLTGG